MQIDDLLINDLAIYDKNSRTHSDAQVQEICDSIKAFGFNNPILIDENRQIIAGHGRLLAAKKLKLKIVPTITLSHLTDAKKKAYVIADNKLALNAGWDYEILMHELDAISAAGIDVGLTGWTPDEIAAFTPEVLNEGECDEDEVPDVAPDPITKLGDIWLLGNHRLMCGDSTSIDSVEKLMNGEKADMVFTDPPYNTGMTTKSQAGSGELWKGNKKGGNPRLSHMFNDSYSAEEWQTFMASFMASYWMLMKDNSVAYICLDWRRNHELIPHIDAAGYHRSNLIVWDKVVHGLGSDYKYTYELINVCKKGKPTLDTHQGDDREYSDVWHIQRVMGKNEDHATAKPIALMERAMRHASKPKDLIADLFGGSGSTLIACEKTNRKCFMMELSPNYCDVIIKRWQKFSGKNATLEISGKSFDEVANG